MRKIICLWLLCCPIYTLAQTEVTDSTKTEVQTVDTGVREVNFDSLDVKKNIYYLKGVKTPFSGEAFALNKRGGVVEKAEISEGMRSGKSVTYYNNGMM